MQRCGAKNVGRGDSGLAEPGQLVEVLVEELGLVVAGFVVGGVVVVGGFDGFVRAYDAVTGEAADTRYGPVQVKITVKNGKLESELARFRRRLSATLATLLKSPPFAAAARTHRQAGRPNLYVKIPGTPEGVPAIEESIFAGVPINVTLLFDWQQYLAAANAYLDALAHRLRADGVV